MINSNYNSLRMLIAVLAVLVAFSGCKKDLDDLQPATFPSIGDVFIDGFSPGLQYAAFGGSDVTGFQVVNDVTYEGDAAMRFAVPDVGDPAGSFVGGVFSVPGGRDLTQFNALTFWARASTNATIDVIGFGDDLGENKFVATLTGGATVNTNWKQFTLPIPDPTVLTMEKGMFVVSEGPEDGNGYTFWIDEVKFEFIEGIAQYEPGIQNKQSVTVSAETGDEVQIEGLVQTANLPNGVDQSVNAAPAYFDFSSSNSSVATVSAGGKAMVLDAGSTTITAKLAGLDAVGELTIISTGDPILPPPSPAQTRDADSVIALWSDDYEERPVDTWNARYEFSTAEEQFIEVDGDNIIRYKELNFVGIEFKTPTIDVSSMTHFHINIWTPDETAAPNEFKVLLADAGPDNTLGTGDDTNDELTFTAPLLQTQEWVTIEIPLSNFSGLGSLTNLTQMVLSGSLPNVFVDNVYFYIEEVDPPILPTTGGPTPTQASEDVISIYSDAYMDVPNLGYNLYGAADFEIVNFGPDDNALKYTLNGNEGGNFQVLELGGANQIDAAGAGMTNFRFDLFFPNAGVEAAEFLLKLVDFGSDPPPTASITINSVSNPAIAQGTWLQFDYTLAELAGFGMTSAGNVQQVVFDMLSSGQAYVDNIYFYKEPVAAVCDPPMDPSMTTSFPIDFEACEDLSGVFESGDGVTGFPVANPDQSGINTSSIVYQFDKVVGSAWYSGIFHNFASPFDLTTTKVFKLKIWSPKPNIIVRFQVEKEGGGAVTYQKTATTGAANTWTELSFDFSDQPFIDGFTPYDKIVIIPDDQDNGPADGSIYYLDDIELTTGGGGGGDIPPTTGAPAPAQSEDDVISVYSDAYTDVPNVGFNLYGGANFEVVNFGPNDNALRYTLGDPNPPGNFQVIELGGENQIDAMGAGMTNFRFDLYFPLEDVENEQFLLKLVDASNFAQTADITINNAVPGPTIAQGTWINFDFTLAELMADYNLPGAAAIQQVVIDLLSSGEVYVDNIYFYGSGGGGGDMPPSTGAPAPAQSEDDVISVYSDAYTDVPNVGFNLYGGANFEVVNFGPNDNALRYTLGDPNPPGNFQVIELGGENQIDAMGAGMTNFRFDLYFPLEDVENEQFLLKLVDASNFAQTADITINNAVPGPTIAQGTWINFDFTLAELIADYNLPGAAAIQQVVIDLLSSGEVYVDNIYFYAEDVGSNACDPPMDPSMTTSFPIDFENCEDLSFVFEGPDPSGFPTTDFPAGNGSTGVYQFNKAGPWFAGIGHTFSTPFDMTTNKKFTLKIWSPKPNAVIRFAIEKNGNPGSPPSYIDRQTVVNANTWTTLTFDFSDEVFSGGTTGYDQIIIIPDDAGDGSPDIPLPGDTYYIDDIQQTN